MTERASKIYFEVQPKLQVPMRGRLPDVNQIEEDFWSSGPARRLRDKVGCYVFAIDAPGRGGAHHLHPIYIGKTTRSFRLECFDSDKIKKLIRFLQEKGRRVKALYLILIAYPGSRKGRPNGSAIDELETFLIEFATRSPFSSRYLINHRKTKPAMWGIRGIVRGGRGRESREARELAEMLELDGRTARRRVNRKPTAKSAGAPARSPKPSSAP